MKITKSRTLLILGWLALSTQTVASKQNILPGLSVQKGRVQLHGKPYQGMGANYFSLFSRTLKDPSDTSYQIGLKQLSKASIPFVRFMACGFWPVDWDLYLHDKKAYFRRLDAIVRCAEENKIGLIPSLFWHMPTVPDIVDESMDQLGNPHSKTIAFIQQYTKEMVLRYRRSEAVWGWEFGNEYNLHVDLPNASEHRPAVWPQLKTALKRTAHDELSSQALLTAYSIFSETVRTYDGHRIVITGNSIPRASAYHNTKEKSWRKDSVEQFEEILLRDNPCPFSMISVHLYPNTKTAFAKDMTGLVKTLRGISAKMKTPLFIGEFGAPVTLGEDKALSEFLAIIQAIETNSVPLSAFWVFDYAGQDKDWNVTFDNQRSPMLKLVAEANQRMTTQWD